MPIKFFLLGGDRVFFWKGGGWKCQFYFYGRGDFSEFHICLDPDSPYPSNSNLGGEMYRPNLGVDCQKNACPTVLLMAHSLNLGGQIFTPPQFEGYGLSGELKTFRCSFALSDPTEIPPLSRDRCSNTPVAL